MVKTFQVTLIDEADKGYFLLCVAYAKSDCMIAIDVEKELF